MAIHQWPKHQRPREKLLEKGPKALSDQELLAIFLRTGVSGMSAIDLASKLLTHFGGLGSLLSANQTSFCSVKGLGVAKYCQLKATLELTERYLAEQLRDNIMASLPTLNRLKIICLFRCAITSVKFSVCYF